MATIKTYSNCKILVRSRDHNPPHVHIRMSDGREALIHIADQTIVGNIQAREIRTQLIYIATNKEALTQRFEELNP